MKIKDRVKEFKRIKAGELIPNPKNWRTHPQAQQDALRGVLSEIGFAGAVLVRKTKKGYMLIDGHLRAETAPDMMIPALVLDVTEKEAEYLMATVDPLGALAEADAEMLGSLLKDVSSGNAAVQEMLEGLAAQEGMFAPEGIDAPKLPDGDKGEFQQITFTLHDKQAARVITAIQEAKDAGCDSDMNANSNGNAIAYICEAFLNG